MSEKKDWKKTMYQIRKIMRENRKRNNDIQKTLMVLLQERV